MRVAAAHVRWAGTLIQVTALSRKSARVDVQCSRATSISSCRPSANTLILFVDVRTCVASCVGALVGAMRVSPSADPARLCGTLYSEILVRNTPLSLLMFFFAFGYPKLDLGISRT
jgi:ABC-type amino acid transport system permease subunit